MPQCGGDNWSVRQATVADAAVIAGLVGHCAGEGQGADCATALLDAYPALHILFRNGAAVGVCGIEDARPDGTQVAANDIELRMIVFVGDELDATVTAETAERLVGELALSVDLPGWSIAAQPTFYLVAL